MNSQNKKIPCDGIIFDIDGTIWDATGTAVHAYNEALKTRPDLGVNVTPDDLKKLFGLPMEEIGRRLLPMTTPEESHDLMEKVAAHEPVFLHKYPPKAYPGADKVFSSLSEKIPVLIVSNCQAGYIHDCVTLTGLKSYVTEGICPADTGLLKAENIRLLVEKYHLAAPVYVGDTDMDHDACKKAGVPFVFAAYGYGQTEDPDAVIQCMEELPDVLELPSAEKVQNPDSAPAGQPEHGSSGPASAGQPEHGSSGSVSAGLLCSPFLPGWEYIADGEPHIFGDRLYIIGSHDRFNSRRFCFNDYVGWSAPLSDLSDWRYEGVTYKKTQDPGNRRGWYELWAPDAARGADGRYYLYYCLADRPWIGVAVCDTPAGQYEFLGYVRDSRGQILGQRKDDLWPFDPAVLVDDDGSVHLYTGQSPLTLKMAKKKAKTHKFTCHMELEADMLTLKTEPAPLLPNVTTSAGTGFEGHEFFEASSIRKFEGRYYFIYSSVRLHELCWSVSDRPDGGFRYGGVLVSNGDLGFEGDVSVDFRSKGDKRVKNYIGNNHGSVEKIGDSYYVFYHRQTNRHMYSRQACVAKIEFENGAFRQAEMTSCGLSDSLPGRGRFDARIACELYSKNGASFSISRRTQDRQHPAFTQDTPDGQSGEQYISNLRDGASAVFKYFAPADISRIRLMVRGKAEGVVKVYANDRLAATIPVTPHRHWTITPKASFQAESKKYALRFTFEGTGALDFKGFEIK